MAAIPPTLLFDGDCGICTVLAERAAVIEQRRFGGARYAVEPYQAYEEPTLKEVGLDYATCNHGIQLVEAGGRVRGGPWAVNRFLWGTWWSPLVVILYLAPFLLLFEMIGYRVVAQNRHKISARLGLNACKI